MRAWRKLSIVITLGILILDWMPVAKAPMILVVNASDLKAEKPVTGGVAAYDKHYHLKSRNRTQNRVD